jgi:hypothetical protein
VTNDTNDILIFWLSICLGLIIIGCIRWLFWTLKINKATRLAVRACQDNPEAVEILAHTYASMMTEEAEEVKRKAQEKRYNQARKRKKS